MPKKKVAAVPRFRLGVAVPFHKQYEVGLAFLAHMAWLKRKLRSKIEFTFSAAISADWPLARFDGWEVSSCPNTPLSDKFNAAVEPLRDRVDAVMILGMDDFLSPGYFDEIIQLFSGIGVRYAGPNGCHFLDRASRVAVYCPATNTVGAGRVISSKVLDALDWKPYPPEWDNSLDHVMRNRVIEATGHEHAIPMDPVISDHTLIDVKTGDNRNAFSRVSALHASRQVNDLQERFPEVWALLFERAAEYA